MDDSQGDKVVSEITHINNPWVTPKELVDRLLENEEKKYAISVSDYSNKLKSTETTDTEISLDSEIIELKQKIISEVKNLKELSSAAISEKDEKIEKLKAEVSELIRKERFKYIFNKVGEEAKEKLKTSPGFEKIFEFQKCEAVIVSIDIRRSTQLMLDAKQSLSFIDFISRLIEKLKEIIVNNYGVFDKFTGDGILAYFPYQYSSDIAILYALKAAEECQKKFVEHYKQNRNRFSIIRSDTGLGIGVDFGEIYTTQFADNIQIVGKPVVYSCRLSGAPHSKTYLNQNAYDEFIRVCRFKYIIQEEEFEVKHEGPITVYVVELDFSKIELKKPDWDQLLKQYTSNGTVDAK